MKLSIVSTMYKSESYIKEFYERITSSVKEITEDYEIILVNDGSPDNSLNVALELYNNDSRVKIADLSRNFGHHKAVMTGLSYAQGEFIFLIDIDLEEAPENLSKFWKQINDGDDADVVYALLEERKGGLFEKLTGNLFFLIFNSVSNTRIPVNFGFSRIFTRRYADALLEYREKELFLGGVWSLAGFKQEPLVISKSSKGSTTYTLAKKVSLSVNAITSFSNKPLIYIFFLGVLMIALSMMVILFLVINKIVYGITITGWTSLMVSLWLVGGIIVFSLGVISIYLSKIFIEVKDRPYTVVKNFYKKD